MGLRFILGFRVQNRAGVDCRAKGFIIRFRFYDGLKASFGLGGFGALHSSGISDYIYIYMYIYIERERESVSVLSSSLSLYVKEIIYMCVYMYIYIYIHTYVYTHMCIYIYIYTHTHICFKQGGGGGVGGFWTFSAGWGIGMKLVLKVGAIGFGRFGDTRSYIYIYV